jgi:hypothetical protein
MRNIMVKRKRMKRKRIHLDLSSKDYKTKPTNENKLKVRMIKTPEHEEETIFIVLDRFLPFTFETNSYLLGCKLYIASPGIERSRRYGEEIDSDLRLRGNGHDPVGRNPTDVFELPTIREYTRFMDLLKKNGYFWNKKKDTLTKDGRLIG